MELKGWALAAPAALAVASVAAVVYIMLTGVLGGDGSYNEPYPVILWDDFGLASYSGRVILVNVGATWCGTCAMEIQELKTVRDEFSENELAMISIFYDPRDNPHIVAEYARERRITWDVVYGGGAFEVFPVQLYPTLFILDKNLNLAFRRVGVATSTDTIKDVLSLLEQQSN